MNSRPAYYPILALLLLFVYFLGSFKVVQPYIEYKVNYEYISTVLCINKEKPQLSCHGKCHLEKELKKAAKEESQKKESFVKLIESEIIPASGLVIFLSNPAVKADSVFPQFDEGLCSISLLNATPPPRA